MRVFIRLTKFDRMSKIIIRNISLHNVLKLNYSAVAEYTYITNKSLICFWFFCFSSTTVTTILTCNVLKHQRTMFLLCVQRKAASAVTVISKDTTSKLTEMKLTFLKCVNPLFHH